jgi:superfamily II DNA or RNA helicase
MNLVTRLAGDFSTNVRNRGKIYYWQGRVRIQHGSDSQVEAQVRGSRQYEVSLDYEAGVLSAWCDCSYFDSGGPCKHLWATILAADARGYLLAASRADLVLDCGDLEDGKPFLSTGSPAVPKPPPPPQPPAWKAHIIGLSSQSKQATHAASEWPAKRELMYVVDVTSSMSAGNLLIRLWTRDRKQDGSYTRSVAVASKRIRIAQLPRPEDREIVSALAGGAQYSWGYTRANDQIPDTCLVAHPLSGFIMPLAARTGRCLLQDRNDSNGPAPLAWDEGGAWELGLAMHRDRKGWTVSGVLRRGEERMDVAAAILVTEGLVFAPGRVAPLAEGTPFEWLKYLRRPGVNIQVAEKDTDEFLATLLCSPGLPALEAPEELRYTEVSIAPRPGLRIRAPESSTHYAPKLRAELSFDYEGRIVSANDESRGFYDAAARHFLRRHAEAEESAAGLLNELGLKFRASSWDNPSPRWELAPTKLPRTVRALLEAGWHIDADGKIFRRPGSFHIQVSTGVDWFELHGGVDYGETSAKLPALLEALRRGDNMVRLDDGTYGMMPEEWLRRIGMLAGAGVAENGHVRFRRTQAGLLDALLAVQPEATCDEAFTRVREELRLFQGVEPARQPAGFVGSLRDYQREGLGWMEFLRRFSFGGCLADDMGVGKTAQVLALLETRRELRVAGERVAPSLVVVPRSLVFNWKEEAKRFTPQLRVLDHTGSDRNGNSFADYDLVLTTYGTLRQDAVRLKDVEFDYVVLDEAQAVKNADTESAKAVRLLRGGHRLALSGTPVENHLGELWSLFEFLNPGMLGAASVFKMAGGAARSPDEDTRRLLAHALRPFILRRTKGQVASELPPKTEQTVHCEMESGQRKLYDELRQHYRNSLLQRIETDGMAKSKIQVLEALLRLRQAACHPGLIDPQRKTENSGKLDVLLARLREVLDEGHKALVFSQFTSLLRIVRDRLDGERIAYEYLDGATRDRQARVERFQNEADCRLFLVSLKAGGLGLNLTAAEYVFLLDPWWNPAVEAQAVDRAHRIGQTRQVFAYRLIARDTVEEKVLELQQTKRDLAEAIISADNSLIRNLRREDLELLLS